MMLVVSFVSLMVHIYTIGYMHDDPGYTRFFSYISLFTFSMLMLVMANNFLQLFFGWEAVGLVSYLLIGFWYTGPAPSSPTSRRFSSIAWATSAFCWGSLWCSRIRAASTMRGVRQGGRDGEADHRDLSRRSMVADHGDLHSAVHRRDGQIGAVPAARVAARFHGRPDAHLGSDPRRHHGDGGDLHGGAHVAAVRAVRPPRCRSFSSSVPSPRSSWGCWGSCRTTSSAWWPTRRCPSSAIWRSAWGRPPTRPACSTW